MSDLNPKWMKLAADFLQLAADEFGNHGCNDWDWPADWTQEEKAEMCKAMHEDNGDDEFDPNHLAVPDWWAMTFLAQRLKDLSGKP